jgi:hypothetical protein
VADAIDKLDSVPICECMNCRQAYELALKQFQELYTGNCLHAYFAVVQAHVVIGQMMLSQGQDVHDRALPNAQRVGDAQSEPVVIEALLDRLQAIIDARNVELKN